MSRGRLREQGAATQRWIAWAETHRPSGPLVWVHGASVGELLAAAPVIRRLLRRNGTLTVVASHTSSSVVARPSLLPVSRQDYLPLDSPEDTARTLDAVRPDSVVIARGDLWPGFLRALHARGTPIAVIGAAIAADSHKLRFPALPLYASTVRGVSWIGAVSLEDAERWQRLGVSPDVVEVTGDPRHDEVVERLTDLHAIAPYRAWAGTSPVLVAGSIEPGDLRPLFGAWAGVRDAEPTARLLVVPHDPSAAAIARAVREAAKHDERAVVGSQGLAGTGGTARCAIHDGVGTLADLYALAAVAFVGGGFAKRKLHSVVEPAALAVPVLAGPHAIDDRDAQRLIAGGGLVSGGSASVLGRVWLTWFSDPEARMRAGLAARSALTTGAAERSANAIATLLGYGETITPS
jgi:3-deoxy-D-manno-octulosonic-acid transferase